MICQGFITFSKGLAIVDVTDIGGEGVNDFVRTILKPNMSEDRGRGPKNCPKLRDVIDG